MESSEQHRRKKNHVLGLCVNPRSSFLYLSFLLFLFFFSSSHHSSSSFQPFLLSSTATIPLSLQPQDHIFFPDHVLLTLSNSHHVLPPHHQLLCVYHNLLIGFDQLNPVQPVLSTDRYGEFQSIVRCSLPPANFTTFGLRRRGDPPHRGFFFPANEKPRNWDNLVYEATLDGDTVVVFVKGLNLRPHRISDPTRFRCHFGNRYGAFGLTTKVVSVAQEVVRCSLPQSILRNPDKAREIKVTVSHVTGHVLMPSVARIGGYCRRRNGGKKFELCVCTMVWNQARAIKEWVMFHSWLGVERWFIYDNNSDDDIKEVVEELDLKGYNISREIWPWIKSQEAGFSHCGLKAKEECKWVGFFDVDEFFYFPKEMRQNSLRSVVANFSSSDSIAEIRTGCHSFGPSGLKEPPKQGVTIGYTCRLQGIERHKSIVRPDLLHGSLMNVVHHFELKEGFKHRNMARTTVVINHYKYQVWETFKAKFFRRVATYVVDWKEDQNKGSKDRAPGLGTQAIEPPDWRLQFCEVWDTGLKDLLVSNFADPATGLMPWEKKSVK